MVLFTHDETGVTAARHLHQKYFLSQFVWWLWRTCWRGVCFWESIERTLFPFPSVSPCLVACVAYVQRVRKRKRGGGGWSSFDLSSSKFSVPIKTATTTIKKTTWTVKWDKEGNAACKIHKQWKLSIEQRCGEADCVPVSWGCWQAKGSASLCLHTLSQGAVQVYNKSTWWSLMMAVAVVVYVQGGTGPPLQMESQGLLRIISASCWSYTLPGRAWLGIQLYFPFQAPTELC